jgi:hypothetical protein
MKSAIALIISSLIGIAAFPQCSPEKVVKIVSVNESPGIDNSSFSAKPLTIYRMGSKYARIEEAADEANGIHALIVTAEPDSWMVNLVTKTGQHIVDPDPKGVVIAPIFTAGNYGSTFPKELQALEYGCEGKFFDDYKSPYTDFETPRGKMVKQAVGLNGWKAVLIRPSKGACPIILFLFHGDEIVFAIRYTTYEIIQEAPSHLFTKPEGIKYDEAKSA